MSSKFLQMLIVTLCLVCVLCFDSRADTSTTENSNVLDGLWSGSWGHLTDRDGTVHQPVKAELFIQGDHVEWSGFPGMESLTGTIRIDAGTKKIRVTPAVEAGSQPKEVIVYEYKIKGNALELIDGSKRTIDFTPTRSNPLAGVSVEILAAIGTNDAGELLVTDFEVHRASRSGEATLAFARRPLNMKQGTMFLMQEGGLKKVDMDEVRRLIHGTTTVVVAYRPDDRPSLPLRERWQETDSQAVARTISRVLRPDTLVFVVPQSAKVPPPP